MDNYECNCIVFRTILGSYLSDSNKLVLLWNYGILLPEKEEDTIPSFLLNLTIVQLKQILESCGIITIKDNNIKFVLDTSGHRGTYSWSMFLLENSLLDNYFTEISVSSYNVYQKNVYFIGLGNDRNTTINLSNQFHYKKQSKNTKL